MKKLLLPVSILAIVMLVATGANAQGKIAVNIGADVLMPIGSFSDAVSIGFGGTAQGEYLLAPNASLTLKSGYVTWSAKDVPSGFKVSYSGIPILVGGKYYFMPEGKTRFYGTLEVGLMILSASAEGTYGGQTYKTSASETDFSVAPGVGVEIAAGAKGAIDISARYWGIFKDGSASNIGARVGYKFFVN
jgi:hypothetical protein